MSSRQLYRIVAPKREPIAHDRWRPGRGGVVLLSSVLADFFFFFFKQKTAYEIHSDWSSDVCSSDLSLVCGLVLALHANRHASSTAAAREIAQHTHHLVER